MVRILYKFYLKDKQRFRSLTRPFHFWRQRHLYFDADLHSVRNRMLLGLHVEKPKEDDTEGEEYEWAVTLRAKKDMGIKAWGKSMMDRYLK